jgi:hypothetical protein
MLKEIIFLTLIVEILIIIGRLLFGSNQKRFREGRTFLKIRIHHGYYGILLILIYLVYPKDILFIFGMALVLSEIIHHLIVLPLWVGRTEFP